MVTIIGRIFMSMHKLINGERFIELFADGKSTGIAAFRSRRGFGSSDRLELTGILTH